MTKFEIVDLGLTEAIRRRRISLTQTEKKLSSFRGSMTHKRVNLKVQVQAKAIKLEGELLKLEAMQEAHRMKLTS